MIDYSYVELTSACLTAMRKFARRFPQHRPREIEGAIRRGAEFIKAVCLPVCDRVREWGGWMEAGGRMNACRHFLFDFAHMRVYVCVRTYPF